VVYWSVLTSRLGLWTGSCGLFVARFVGVDVDWSIRVVVCLVRWGWGLFDWFLGPRGWFPGSFLSGPSGVVDWSIGAV
jgi:hypothetical protein